MGQYHRRLRPIAEQELWGVLLVYNLLRREILLAAASHDVDPNRISLVDALFWIRTFWLASWKDTPGRLHGLIRKVGSTYKYYVTELGRAIITTALKLKRMVFIPELAKNMAT